MNDLIFAILAVGFLALIAATVAAIRNPAAPTRLCAIASLPATCGDVR